MAAKTVDEMILGLPKPEQVIVKRLRALIIECLPEATEKAYYGMGVPFYTHKRMICFIWPQSVFWGPKRTIENQSADGVSLGFCQGNRMSNDDGVLKAEGRKQVYVMYFHTLKDIDDNQVKALLFEAGMIDGTFTARLSSKKKG